MPDRRKHRGAHEQDARDFGVGNLQRLRDAVQDMSFLRGRDYAEPSAIKVVGDRYQLTTRQRKAVSRSACSDEERTRRAASGWTLSQLRGKHVSLDGFNCLITLESALSGAPILVGRDGAHRDMAGVHGTYRSVEETEPALSALCSMLVAAGPASTRWLLDRPVSNSGRLRATIESACEVAGLPAEVGLDDDVDRSVLRETQVVASCDRWIMDHAPAWVDLPGAWVAAHREQTWRVDLGQPG